MWKWDSELRELGFRRRSERYWQCENRFGLTCDEHLSIFPWSEQNLPGTSVCLVEVDTFHVTFLIGFDHVHFYYHEVLDNDWSPGGHTSSCEIRRLGENPRDLRRRADEIAAQFVEALGGILYSRRAR